MPARPNTIDDVLYRLVIQEDGCFTWPGKRNDQGYGLVNYGGKKRQQRVHKVVYEHFHGPVPEGREIDHLCRNRACANPAHLESVTHRENVMRGEGWAGKKTRQTYCIHGHALTEDNLRSKPSGRRDCKRCHAIRENERYHRRNNAATYTVQETAP